MRGRLYENGAFFRIKSTIKMDSYQITFETYNKIAELYQEKFMKMDLYNDTYDIFCALNAKTAAHIFEIACGPGNITQYLLQKRPDFIIEAIDVAPNMLKLAQINNPTAHFKVMDCREIDTISKKFDAIMCGFCMPYLSKNDCNKLIKDAHHLLNDNGIFYFSTIEGNYEKSGYEMNSKGDKIYLYYHEEKYLVELLEQNNFEVVFLQKKDYPQVNKMPQTHLIFIAKKK